MIILYILAQAVLLVFALTTLWYFFEQLRSLRTGVPYISSSPKDVATMLALAGDISGKRVYDLGSGDGRFVIAAARSGAIATGYEINRFAARLGQFRIHRARLKQAYIVNDSFFNHSLKDADIIFMYLLPHLITKLKHKLVLELKPDTIVVSKGFPVVGWNADSAENGFYRYTRKNAAD